MFEFIYRWTSLENCRTTKAWFFGHNDALESSTRSSPIFCNIHDIDSDLFPIAGKCIKSYALFDLRY